MNGYPVLIPVWCSTIAPTFIPINELHIWQANLDQPDAVLTNLAQTLSADETERVQRLRFAQHRQRAIASRGILRQLLSRYLQSAPAQLQFCYDSQGKPELSLNSPSPLTFNVSHSNNVVLYALGVGDSVGIDVEAVKPVPLLSQLIKRYFSPAEQAAIALEPAHQQERSFYYHWIAKEALTKATGRGIIDLPQVELVITPTHVQTTYTPQSGDRWQVHLLEPQPGYAAAIAYAASTPFTLKFFDWGWA